MASCPSCRNRNLRDNYHPAPLIYRLFGIRALICNDCNRQFHAFALRSPTGGVDPYAIPPDELSIEARLAELEKSRFGNVQPSVTQSTLQLPAEIGPVAPATVEPPMKTPARRERVTVALRPEHSLEEMAQGKMLSARGESGAHVLKFQSQNNEVRTEHPIELKAAEPNEKLPPCPQCGSYNVRRRLRKRLERVTVAMLDNEAFHCDHCQTPFYSSPEDELNNQSPAG
jgi:hypothetical protein